MARSHRLSALLLCVGVGAAAYFAFDFAFRVMHDLLIDDAYIVLRHSENFARGFGLNFNPGERVEGYTTFLFALWESVPFALGINPLTFTKISGIGFAVAFVTISYGLARQYVRPLSAGLIALSLGFAGNVAYMSVWGLETVLYAALFAASWLAAIRDRPVLAGVLMALTATTRMEAALLALGILVYYGVANRRSAMRYGVALASVFAPYFIARAIFYEALLPNPYTAKVGSVLQMAPRGWRYLLETMSFGGFWVPMAFVTLVAITLGRKKSNLEPRRTHAATRDVVLLAYLAIVYPLYIIRVGGDHYYTFLDRFLVHEYPAYFILGFLIIERATESLNQESGWRTGIVRYGAPILLTALSLGVHYRNWPVFDRPTIAAWKAVGQYLRAESAGDSRVAVDAAGAIPYYSALPAIDMMGLADKTIARTPVANMGEGPAGHERHNSPYVLSRQPAWISSFVTPYGALGPDLWNNIDLRRNYDLHALADFDDATIVPIDRVAVSASGLLTSPARPSQRWGIWKRRSIAREQVVLSALDFEGSDGAGMDPARVTNVRLVAAIGDSARLRTVAFTFVPGRYRVAMTLAADRLDGGDPTKGGQPGPRCASGVVYESDAGQVLAMTQSATPEISFDFIVTDANANRPRTISLTCVEPWHGRLESASISSVD